MSKSEAWRKVGKIKDAHSLKGELQVLVFAKETPWLKSLKQFALAPMDQETNLTVYQVERAKPFKEGLILKPENVVDRTQAEKFKGLLFFVPAELFESQEGETIYLTEIDGFTITDPNGEALGNITGFTTNMAQDLLIVEKAKGGKAEIPFVQNFIVGIDFENRTVKMDLPEGIWDLDQL